MEDGALFTPLEKAEGIAHPHEHVALGERSAGHPNGLVWAG